ncbi:CotS family spore coat protein [Clostridiaceae bacterium UIB06]|uniref:CotS family spore coat protein n=1 Tax=Clostridium thailandense TaxID=2794346 RepID=A0A949TVT7_9CLOT|nr:CotS family spore coat protein [Clostridium thailandense]MBV7272380.1 CotS family spore coat protein [Clostridium thailandense]MCH5135907.1 CotS family spore coat protein [Clostridiaceae bacterium UIB06]
MLDKYKEKDYLTKYDLCIQLFNRFNLKVHDVMPVRGVYIVSTNDGEKVLKRVEYTKEELRFIYSILSYIRTKFSRVMDFVKDVNGEIYTIWNGNMYCVMDMVEGKECNFNSPIDVKIAARGLGELHNASEGFKTSLNSKYNNGKLVDTFKRRIQEMEFFKNIASVHRKRSEFDEIFLNNVDIYIEEIKKSIDMLQKSFYYKLCSEEDKIVICHHDLAYHNILINNEEAYFIDFDYAMIDLKVHDLCNFINKVVKSFAFDIEKASIILENYFATNTLNKRELEVLHAMLTFPEDFYSISKDYYTKRKDWEEDVFLDRLKRKSNYKEDREEFLEKFREDLI